VKVDADCVESVPVYAAAGRGSLDCAGQGPAIRGAGEFVVRLDHAG
jgi:hypothetical protein